LVTGECFCADKLLEDAIGQLLKSNPGMSSEERDNPMAILQVAAYLLFKARFSADATRVTLKI